MQAELFQKPQRMELNMAPADSGEVPAHYSFFPLLLDDNEVLLAGIGREHILSALTEVVQLNARLEQEQKELSEANARLKQLAEIDQLTQVYNRHHFFRIAEHFWQESRRYKLPMIAIMIDLDTFKSVNDSHGHLFGSSVLQQVASRLRNNVRKSDILARYGGDEFVLIALNTHLLTGLVLAERLRFAVAAEPFRMKDHSATVTISVGVSGTELANFHKFESLLESSDRALYVAKRAGKNCVRSYADINAAELPYPLQPADLHLPNPQRISEDRTSD